MPTYEYVCTHCGYEFELTQKMSDPPRKTCPRCRKRVKRKLGTGAGIIFKGSGFYATDYRSADYVAKAKAEKGGSSDSKTTPGGSKSGAGGKAGKTDGKGGGSGTSGATQSGSSGTESASS